ARAEQPADALRKAAAAFAAVHSFHGTMQMPGGRNATMDFSAPNRYRMQMAGSETIVIGSKTYMKMGGQWMSMPMSAVTQTLANMRHPADLQGYLENAKISDLGPSTLDGMAMHRYHMQSTAGGNSIDSTIWIGPGDLPYRND